MTDQQTVLIIDDNATNLRVLANYLREYDFKILAAQDGKSGIERAIYTQPDIILLDVMMPEIDGFDTCRQLKEHKHTKHIPIIFMTALAHTEDKVKGFEAGAVDYITKPLQYEEVLARVSTHLRLQKLTQSLQKTTEDLQVTNQVLSKRALQLEISSEVGQQITSILDLDELLLSIVHLIQVKFGYYSVGVWLLEEEKQQIVLQAHKTQAEEKPHLPGLTIALDAPQSIVAWVCQTKASYLASNVATNAKYLPSSYLPATQSELGLPLRIGDELIGVLDIQSECLDAFDEEDVVVLQTLADQIAVAIHNARLYGLEKNLRRLEAEKAQDLAELNNSKDKFFSIISHDLVGPFNVLMGNAQLMRMSASELSPSEVEEMAHSIYVSARSAHNLLQNLLTWSLMQRGRMVYQAEDVDIHELAHNTVDLLRGMATNKQITLGHDVPVYTIVKGDKNMLDTIIRNLVSNALKFTPAEGQVTISAQASEDFVEVQVSDTGVGIEQNAIHQLFHLDTHHTTQGTAREKGTGLGLIVCREMVEKNGGQIVIDSKVGQGTTIRFTVPASAPDWDAIIH